MDTSEPTPTEPRPPFDAAAEERRIEELGEHIDETAKRADDDLEIGGSGRPFADEGVRAQVEADGDTHHPPADR